MERQILSNFFMVHVKHNKLNSPALAERTESQGEYEKWVT